MKRLTCEMCGSTDLIKQDGVFVCQTCGCKYSIEEAKKMMVEGTVEVTGTVKVDNSAAIENYLDMARNAIDAGNNKEADEYCNKIIEMDTANWEAWLIKGRAVGWQSTLGNNRVGETINAFSKALENCPEDMKDTLGEQCKLRLGELQAAMLMTRIKCFKPHPSVHDVEGLKSDVSSIITTTLNFLANALSLHLTQAGRTPRAYYTAASLALPAVPGCCRTRPPRRCSRWQDWCHPQTGLPPGWCPY